MVALDLCMSQNSICVGKQGQLLSNCTCCNDSCWTCIHRVLECLLMASATATNR